MILPSAHQLRVKQTEAKAEVAKRACERSLVTFVRHAWPIVEHGRPYVHNWHIECICEHLEAVTRREIRNLIINIPPRHMKSMAVAVFWPAWVWTWKPEECWLFGSYNPKLSTRDAVKCRRVLDSHWFLRNWGGMYFGDAKLESILASDQNEKMRYTNLLSGGRISTSIGGLGTGDGGDIICVDDPLKAGGVESEVRRQAAIDWWDDEMSTRGNDPKTVCRLVIMQRLHDNDLTGHLLEKADVRYEHLCLPFEYERKMFVDYKKGTRIGVRDPRKKEGELLWPERYDEAAVADLKTSLTPYQQSGQLQQRPTPKEGSIFKREWFKRRWEELPLFFDHILTCWDLTFDDTEGSAYNVGYCLGLKIPDIYVLDEKRDRMDIIAQLREIPALKIRNPNSREILIENAANGKATVKLLRDKIPGLMLVNPIGSKEDRARAVTWVFESGNVLFPKEGIKPWSGPALEEIVGFGPKAKYKDRVDALVHGVQRLVDKMKAVSFSIPLQKKESEWKLR